MADFWRLREHSVPSFLSGRGNETTHSAQILKYNHSPSQYSHPHTWRITLSCSSSQNNDEDEKAQTAGGSSFLGVLRKSMINKSQRRQTLEEQLPQELCTVMDFYFPSLSFAPIPCLLEARFGQGQGETHMDNWPCISFGWSGGFSLIEWSLLAWTLWAHGFPAAVF